MRSLCTFLLMTIFFFLTRAEDQKPKAADPFEKKEYKNPLSHGFGDDVEWVEWEKAIDVAAKDNKPIFLLIHKSWCHACQLLKKKFDKPSFQKTFTAVSKYFVMVNTEDDDEPWEEKYRPDGKYIPRILFLDSEGDMLNIKGMKPEFEKYKHYYSTPGQVISSMEEVLNDYGVKLPEELIKMINKAKAPPVPEKTEL